jgi:glycopeptide antibiotics resistance protein
MLSYIEPIKFAIFVFPFLALALFLPFAIFEYRKYGSFNGKRGFVLYTFIFYLLCAYFLVILPLPSREAVAQMTGPTHNFVLFKSWVDFFSQTTLNIFQPATYLGAIKQSVFLEPVFNVLLVLPFGIFLRYYFRQSLKKVILFSFCLSLFFELTQFSGLYFIYPRAYRLFDVNDLLHNTLGGMLGYAVAPLFSALLPSREKMDQQAYEAGQKVTLMRRAIAAIIDWLIIGILTPFIGLLVTIFSGNTLHNVSSSNLVVAALQVIIYFMILCYFLNGQTIGKKIVRIRVAEKDHPHIRFWTLVKRYGFLYLFFGGIWRAIGLFTPSVNSTNRTLQMASLLIILLCLGTLFLLVMNLLIAFITRKKVLFYEKISHSYSVSTISKPD